MDKIDFGKVLTINVDCNLGKILALQEKVNELVEWANKISKRIGLMEDEYKQHLYGAGYKEQRIEGILIKKDKKGKLTAGKEKKMKIAIDPEKIAEIRNALQVISLSVKTLAIGDILLKVPKQVRRIDTLLPYGVKI